ncbi:hypothetical protein KR767_20950 [Luteibacter anthropi]|uniref:hypothetical protein n=1 Tax=Luteibacter anthropi TaxID=564369 RepID=UPI002032DA89|nr:hypothetical protein [Luteibacter anthropi]URX62469.1 hypothetical protein KR767_20950 [Luteibacter anthropi]
MLVAWEASAQTATTNPENEYKKLVEVKEDIQPIGDNPFGENVNVYDGTLSFHVTDFSLPGNGPAIEISRTFQADGDSEVRRDNASFGDWDLDLPRFSTLTSNQSTLIQGPTQIGWVVDTDTRTDRCSNFLPPPPLRHGRPPDDNPIQPSTWWNEGYSLRVPGKGAEDMLMRSPSSPAPPQMAGLNFVGVSKGNWNLACLPNTVNGEPGEAFLAVGPDGSKYWLNYLTYRAARNYGAFRRLGLMFATRVEDRFGNWLTYTYDAGRIMSIDASDGRKVTFSYTDDGKHIAQINAVGANMQRSWRYGYSPSATGVSLSTVQLPDASSWGYSLQDLTFNVKSTPATGHCLDPLMPDESLLKTGTITSPSGLTGVFETRPTRHGRSDVREVCNLPPGGNASSPAYEMVPRYYNNLALRRKTITGAGLGRQVWSYVYPVATASWKNQCASSGCDYTTYSDVTDPSGNVTRYVFSNRMDATEGKALRTDYYGSSTSVGPVRSETFAYGDPTRGPWPAEYGYTFNAFGNSDRAKREAPLSERHIYQEGDHFDWYALDFDVFARPGRVRRESSVVTRDANGQPLAPASVDERTTYLDDTSRWVLGLPLQTDNLSTGETVSRNVYDPGSLTLSERYRFGRKVMGYTFNAQGQLASFTDGNGHTTGLENYYRGIPRTIRYPDGTAQTVAVDDFGQITAIADQTGALTSYGYDAIGRLARIDYPAGDSVAWEPKVFYYSYIGAARGVDGPHWMRVTGQGNWSQRIDYDAMLRPVAYGESAMSNGADYVSSRIDYDWAGRKTFQSYRVAGMPDLAGMALGTVTRYDALGRPIQQFQHTELGDLLTTTDYLAGGARQVTDPKGNATTTRYQLFDQPSFDNVIAVEAPEGVVQTIQRDIYGNPRSITQGGQGLSLTKTMTYDGEHRLCRTWEPESGSEIMAYDGADNLAWSVSGASFNGAGCGQDQVTDALKTVRGYDAMNRVTSVVYPAGTEPSSFTYDARGNPATATAGMASWTFGRNKMGLLTAEVLSIDGWSWALGYGYDPKGALSTIVYPDGNIVSFAPNGLRQPTQVSGYASGITYFPDGDVKSYTLGNGAIYTADKNARQLLRNFTYGKNGAPNVSEDFAYDANGNVSQINDVSGANQRSKAMGYDGLNRLVSATASQLWGTESYTYDTLNNIRTLTNSFGTKTYNYDGSNLLRSIGNGASVLRTFNYDARGNTTAKDSQVLNFDLANRLTSIPGKGTYTYDAAGRRVKKVTPQGTTYYAYNAGGQLMWEYDPATTNGTKYVYLGKKLIANAKASTSKVVGAFYGPAVGDDVYVAGWACSTGLPRSIDVHIYIGGVAGAGTFFGAYPANLASEPSLHQECKANGDAYRFQVLLPDSLRLSSGGQPIYIYGISPVGNENAPLTGSGQMIVPRSVKVPPKPASVTATLSGDMSMIQVAWSASATAIRYEVLQVHNGQWTTLYTGAGLAAAVRQPTNGAYAFYVRACNDNGCSDLVESAVVNVAHLPTTPGSVNIPASSTGSVVISWAAAAYAASYQVEHSYDGNWTQVYSGSATSATITETVSSNWYYRVRACNANGCGGYATSSYVPVVVPPTATPTLYGAGTSNTGAYTLSWTGVGGATAYNLVESANGGGWQQVLFAAAGNWSTSGRPEGSYVYQVQACNSSGCGPWSGQVAVVVALPPATPTDVRLVDRDVKARRIFTLYWSASPGATRYEISRYPGGTIVYSGTGLSSVVESGISPYEQVYLYSVRACNDRGCSAWSAQQ